MADAPTARDAPSSVQDAKDQAKEQAHEVASTVAEHASAVTQEAKGKATDVVHDVRRELQSQGDAQAKRVASMLVDVGGQLESMADRGQPGAVTNTTRQLADTSRQVANRLETGGLQGVGDDLASFARRQPVLFLAAAGVAGFVVTRMLRNAPSLTSSSPSGNGASPGAMSTPRPIAQEPVPELVAPAASDVPSTSAIP
jgi:hypothetical protein